MELIIVDDGSSDGTAEAAEQFGSAVEVVRQAKRGPAQPGIAGLNWPRATSSLFWMLMMCGSPAN